MKEISNGFLKKDTKAYKPDKKTGKWRGATTKNGNFATIKPGWTGELMIDNQPHKIEIWAFNTRWGVQSLFYKLHNIKTAEKAKEGYDRSSEF
tara:strand:+ start:61 stop:339 length:279 start_codon:yes stop_codon:yes gene_type:complete